MFVHSLVFSHILGSLDLFLDRLGELMNVNPSMECAHNFLSQYLKSSLTSFTFALETNVGEKWKNLGMNISQLPAYLFELQLGDLWSLTKRTADTKIAANAIISTRPIKSFQSDPDFQQEEEDKEEERVRSNLLISSQLPILSFALNPLDRKQIAYATAKAINEVDTQVSTFYYGVQLYTIRFNLH